MSVTYDNVAVLIFELGQTDDGFILSGDDLTAPFPYSEKHLSDVQHGTAGLANYGKRVRKGQKYPHRGRVSDGARADTRRLESG
jgi:hypothetical protein